MRLTRWQAEWSVYALHQLVELCGLHRVPLKREVRDLLQQLDDKLATCGPETESASCAQELNVYDPIGVSTAADILARSPQWVRQIAKDLGGQRTSTGWVFDRQTVVDYAEGRKR